MSGAGLDLSEQSFLEGCLVLPANLTESELPLLKIGVGNLTVALAPQEYVQSSLLTQMALYRDEVSANGPCYSSYIVPESLFPTLNITEDGLTHTWMCAGGPSFVMLGQIVLEHLYSAYNCTSPMVPLNLKEN